MTRASCASGHVVEVIDSFNCERNVPLCFDERQVATRVSNLREFDYFAFAQAHLVSQINLIEIVNDGSGAEALFVFDQPDIQISAIVLS